MTSGISGLKLQAAAKRRQTRSGDRREAATEAKRLRRFARIF
jgi:hypothetical protein